MSGLPVIKGGGEPWTWPDGSLVRVDRSERATPTPPRHGTHPQGGSGGGRVVGSVIWWRRPPGPPDPPPGPRSATPGDHGGVGQHGPDNTVGVRRRLKGIKDWRGLADSLLEGRPAVGGEETPRGSRARPSLGDRESGLAQSGGSYQPRQDGGQTRISTTRLAGLVAFFGGAAFIAYGFTLGWIDGSLGYDDFMMLGIGLEIVGVIAWRP